MWELRGSRVELSSLNKVLPWENSAPRAPNYAFPVIFDARPMMVIAFCPTVPRLFDTSLVFKEHVLQKLGKLAGTMPG
jgi:hypothetical protein